MIIGNYFSGDNNDTLKDIQHDSYGKNISFLFRSARRRYLESVNLIGITTIISKILKGKKSFDHRVLQAAHDIIAAFYRYRYDNKGQMTLFEDEQKYIENLETQWNEYFIKEANDLVENNNYITRNICKATAYQNTDVGYQAEDTLLDLLYDRYGDVFYCARIKQKHKNRNE